MKAGESWLLLVERTGEMSQNTNYSTVTDGPGPTIENTPGPPCKLCGQRDGSLRIHFPPFLFKFGDFEAPPWWEHEKYYCPHCRFLWSDWLDDKSLADYGKEYVKGNYDHHRRPTEVRMLAAPHLLLSVLKKTAGKRFIDYGVGYNTPYIYELRGRGIDLWGCDISSAVAYSRFVRHLPEGNLPEGTFDGIYSLDVAEHLSDIEGDYNRMKHLLRPGGVILHSTLWLHKLWDGKPPFPRIPNLWNPWHVSLCSDRTMEVVAQKTGLDYLGAVDLKVDTKQGYLFRKPGNLAGVKRIARSLLPRFWGQLWQLLRHKLYARCYGA